jgi:hypothetical protein
MALQNAAPIAGLLLTVEWLISEVLEKEKAGGGGGHGGHGRDGLLNPLNCGARTPAERRPYLFKESNRAGRKASPDLFMGDEVDRMDPVDKRYERFHISDLRFQRGPEIDPCRS